jgi:hypothetical protein
MIIHAPIHAEPGTTVDQLSDLAREAIRSAL